MDKELTNVVWYGDLEGKMFRGWWDMGLLENMTSDLTEFTHYEGIKALPRESGGAVVIIPCRLWVGREDEITASIKHLGWVLVILCGGEDGDFGWRDVKHPLMKVWLQLPRMNQHDDVAFHLPNGYRPDTRKLLKEIGQQERQLNFFFAGQVNHERREQCLEELRRLEPEYPYNKIVETDGFGKEVVPYKEYLTAMAQTKIVPCPSGIESPDNFRLYEALEAGCVPVVDAFSTKHKSPGFWKYLFDGDVPFPIIDYWDAFPKLLPELLRDYPANANKCFAWWQTRKRSIKYKMLDDIGELSK